MLTEQQVAERYSGLGGSDAAPALGLSPYRSALDLFLEKRERRAPSPVELSAFRWGHLLEPVIRQEYANVTGRIVRMPQGTLRHPKHAFIVAHLDGVTDDQRVFEAKTARSADGWGKSGTEEVPHHYLIQVQHYLAITGFDVADIAVLIGGSDFRIFEVPADQELQAMIIDGEREFWDMVQRGEPPQPDWDRGDVYELMRRLYPGTDGRTVRATEDDYHHRKVYQNALEMAKGYTLLADQTKAHLLHVMGTAARMTFDDGMQLQRKEVKRREYVVPASSYIDARLTKVKEEA